MRIQGIEPEDAGPALKFVYAMVRRKIGKVVGPIKVQAYHFRLLRATAAMEMGQEAARRLPKSLKTLAGIKVAQRIGCPF
jgi:hypothetical protein